MPIALDSNILIDLLGQKTAFTAPAVAALDSARSRGSLVVCPVVAAETSVYFPTAKEAEETFLRMQIRLLPFGWRDLHLAGQVFLQYRKLAARPRHRVVADFLVAAHALCQADELITRDRGFYRHYFPRLRIVQVLEGD